MKHDLHPVQELLSSLGDDVEIASLLGVRAHVPRDWRIRKSIPLSRWPELYAVGVSADQLLAAHNVAEVSA